MSEISVFALISFPLLLLILPLPNTHSSTQTLQQCLEFLIATQLLALRPLPMPFELEEESEVSLHWMACSSIHRPLPKVGTSFWEVLEPVPVCRMICERSW